MERSRAERGALFLRRRLYKSDPTNKTPQDFARLKLAGCDTVTVTELLLAAAIARGVAVTREKKTPPIWASLWGMPEQELLRFPRDLRRVADGIEKLLQSPVMSPARLIPKYEFGPKSSRTKLLEALSSRWLPGLLRGLAEYLDVFGPPLRAVSSPARVVRLRQDKALSLLLNYVSRATKALPPFASIGRLLRATRAMFGVKETEKRDPFSEKALATFYRRRSSSQQATPGP